MQQRDGIAACFFGEGAVAEGEFHESLNLAELWRLPLLFVCENNLYAMGTRLERSESQPDIHIKAQSYNVPAEVVDGMDVVAVEAAAVILMFEWCPRGAGEWKAARQRVPLVWTKCHLGGVRPRFRCPENTDEGKCCGRRVAKLYTGHSHLFACRLCRGLA